MQIEREQEIRKGRKDWIDFLRAIAIILVVYGHQVPDCIPFFKITSPIKMPLFFAISGYLFSNKTWGEFIKKTLFSLVIPWLSLSLLPQLILLPVKGFASFFSYFVKILRGDVVWFMPCFIIASSLFYLMIKLLHKRPTTDYSRILVGWLLAFVLFAVGICLYNNGILNYGMFNRSLTVLPFFMFGFTFKYLEPYFSKMRDCVFGILLGVLLLFFIVSIVMGFVVYPQNSIDVHMIRYYNYPLCFIQIFIGLLLLFTIFSRITLYPRWMLEVGKDCLVIYIWHPIFVVLLTIMLEKVSLIIPYSLLGIVKTTISIFICCFLTGVIRRFAPFLIGRR